MEEKSFTIIVRGLVQGVGFRPFIFREASALNLKGRVVNTNEYVRIEVVCTPGQLKVFTDRIKSGRPPAALIEDLSVTETPGAVFTGFSIEESENSSAGITEISPDIAVCDDCLEDMRKSGTRKAYAFVNCTNCGPRFTIIKDLPYDRRSTTMSGFELCHNCRSEYDDINDRRFHAQPVACSLCGPHYELFEAGKLAGTGTDHVPAAISGCLDGGGIVLLKGLGGMHLACNPFSREAVNRLRELKRRDGKPLAIMFRGVEDVKEYAHLSAGEEEVLTSWRRPIVLLERKENVNGPPIPSGLFSGLRQLGIMLPYMPIHYQLFDRMNSPAMVLTSGNFSSEPIITDNRLALEKFSGITDMVVLHNRDIYNRTDDSVLRFIAGKPRLFRRSRGYVPEPLRSSLDVDGIIGMGAELTNCFGVGKGSKIYPGQHIGDLQSVETAMFYEQSLQQFIKLMRVTPSLIATDMHPDYISTRSASVFHPLPVVKIQNHHAHIASCMVENGLDEKVIGVAFDGTGYGSDGASWGSEFMICDLAGFSREAHFDYIPLPGGDTAVEEPWRVAVSWLYKVYGQELFELPVPTVTSVGREKIEYLIRMIDRKINTPLSSGAGRFFDAAASLMGLVQAATFQAEGPMRLEALTGEGINGHYDYSIGELIKLDQTIRQLVSDITRGESKVTIATKLHNTVIMIIFDTVSLLRERSGINKVLLSGGVFQNAFLLEKTTKLLSQAGFEVYSQAAVPSNDGGIAPGQMAVASRLRELKCV